MKRAQILTGLFSDFIIRLIVFNSAKQILLLSLNKGVGNLKIKLNSNSSIEICFLQLISKRYLLWYLDDQ